jgi:hypothetical protein
MALEALAVKVSAPIMVESPVNPALGKIVGDLSE